MQRVRAAAVAVAFAVLVTPACGGSDDDDGAAAVTETTVSATTGTVVATTEVAPEQTDPSDSVEPTGTEFCPLTGGDMEGCFDYDDMQQFYDESINTITAFVDATFADPAPMHPAEWFYVPEGETGEEPCTMGAGGFAMYTDMSYEYCPLDQAVYVGQRQLWQFYDEAGDAGAVIGMAHELGHHIQAVAGVGGAGTLEESIVMEDQADCVAGVFTAWLDSEELLDYPDDLEDIDVLMTLIASAEDDPMRDHGTLQERIDSFVIGLEQGMAGCNEFFPDAPLQPDA